MAAGEQNLAEHLLASATGHFKWPTDAVLFYLPAERELLHDVARRLTFQIYLQASKLDYKTQVVNNADSMSPTGTSPFLCLHMGSYPLIFSDFEKLVSFLEAQSLGLLTKLGPQEKADHDAYLSLVKTILTPALTYQCWANQRNVQKSIAIHGYGLCWPLNQLVPRLELCKYVWDYWDMYSRPEREVLLDFEQACRSLSQRLGNQTSFFKEGLTVLDVVLYAHLQAWNAEVSDELKRIVLQFENLSRLT